MATEEKRYLDLTGLSAFKSKLETVMDTKDAALKASLTDGTVTAAKAAEATKATQDGDDNVITTTYETKTDAAAKLAEAKGYTDTEINKIEEVIAEIQENAYDDTAIRALITANTNSISAMDTAYKSADTTLQGNITAEAEARAAADEELSGRLDAVETFFETAEGETLDAALDTLVELQKYLETEGATADQMLLDIAANSAAIEKEVTDRGTAISGVEAAYKSADDALDAKITAAQNAADQAQEEVDALETEVAKKAAQTDLTAAVARIATNESNITTLQGQAHTHDNKATLDAITAEIKAGYDDAVAKKHEHSNKDVLDGITATLVSNWNSALDSAKSYTDAEIAKIGAIDTASIDALFA